MSLFKSHSNYFKQPRAVLSEERRRVDLYLQLKGYDLEQRAIYQRAFDYFVGSPEDFDGATMTEDLCDLPGLDLDAMLHDYLYVNYNAAGSYPYIIKADILMRNEMRRKGKSTINTGLRFVLLAIKTALGYPVFKYLAHKRRMSLTDKFHVHRIYRMLSVPRERSWYNEYRGELIWTFIFSSIIAGYVLAIIKLIL